MKRAIGMALIAAGAWLAAGIAAADGFRTEHHRIESSAAPDAEIYVREKYRAQATPASAGRAVLFVHGATFPGISFDLDVPGYGWMSHVAAHGYTAYYLDLRGYGYSTRPPRMDAPPAANPPFMRAFEAVRDISDAVAFIRQRADVQRISLIGWSWGTVTGGLYAATRGETLDRLVLFAPIYAIDLPERIAGLKLADPDDPDRVNPALGAYRLASEVSIKRRWDAQIVPADKTEWREPRLFRAWIDALLATDPTSAEREPPSLRAPNGVLVDAFEIFSGRPVYEAADITVPTLIVRGDADPTATDADARGLLARLGADAKEYVVIENGSHFINLERNATKVHEVVQAFLDGSFE